MSREMGIPIEQQRAPEQTELALHLGGGIAMPASVKPTSGGERVAEAEHPRSATVRATPEHGSVNRRVLGLTWPVVGEHLLENLLGVVDTLLVAGLGMAALA